MNQEIIRISDGGPISGLVVGNSTRYIPRIVCHWFNWVVCHNGRIALPDGSTWEETPGGQWKAVASPIDREALGKP